MDRTRFYDPRLEHGTPGTTLALEAMHMVDQSVQEAIARAAAQGRRLACGPGCDACCKQAIPLTLLEGIVLVRYMQLHGSPEARRALLAPRGMDCPLLLNGQCAAYPVRPLACRRYLVLDRACAANECPTESRPRDMLIPSRKVLEKALAHTLPWYADRPDCPQTDDSKTLWTFVRSITTLVQNLPWASTPARFMPVLVNSGTT